MNEDLIPYVSCYSFSADATNSAIWRNSKLQALELESTFLHTAALLDILPWSEAVESHRCFADLQVASKSCASFTYALVIKEFALRWI